MNGFAVTDFSNSNSYMDVVQGVLAGGDAWDCTMQPSGVTSCVSIRAMPPLSAPCVRLPSASFTLWPTPTP